MLQLKSLPFEKEHITGPLLLAVLALLCLMFNEQLSQYFIYDREQVNHQQYWRLLTAHLFHTNDAHFLLNILAVILLWALHGQFYTVTQYLSLTLFSGLIISGAIFYFEPNMKEYVGLSGVLHAYFVWGALKDIQHSDKTGYLLLVGVAIKIFHEQLYGASEDIAKLISANVAINAHLSGAIAGLSFFFLSALINKHSINVTR